MIGQKKVKDIMVPIEMYPTIQKGASMLDAIIRLHEAVKNAPPNVPPFRAVLVVDENKKVIGKVGHFAILKGLEPKYKDLFDVEKLSRINLSSSFIETLFEKFSLWHELPIDLCKIASQNKVEDIMQPIEESVEENETLPLAIHKIIMWQCLSVLVKRGNEVVGILRTSDLINEIENCILKECAKSLKKGEKNE
ncbi:MAG: CBS domain-containing protein [Candidatus Kapaibacteriota bacterium]